MSDVSQTGCFVNHYLMISSDSMSAYRRAGAPGATFNTAYRDESMMLLLMLDCAQH